jgi:hypothetical protein
MCLDDSEDELEKLTKPFRFWDRGSYNVILPSDGLGPFPVPDCQTIAGRRINHGLDLTDGYRDFEPRRIAKEVDPGYLFVDGPPLSVRQRDRDGDVFVTVNLPRIRLLKGVQPVGAAGTEFEQEREIRRWLSGQGYRGQWRRACLRRGNGLSGVCGCRLDRLASR